MPEITHNWLELGFNLIIQALAALSGGILAIVWLISWRQKLDFGILKLIHIPIMVVGPILSLIVVAFIFAFLGLFGIEGSGESSNALLTAEALEPSWLYYLVILLYVSVIIPIAEEIIFRRLYFRELKRHCGFWLAMLLSSFVFALLHMKIVAFHDNLIIFITIFIFSCLLSILYDYTKVLWVPIGIHGVYNAIIVTLSTLSLNG